MINLCEISRAHFLGSEKGYAAIRELMAPRNYSEILEARLRPNRDFRVGTGNLENVARCLLVAPHGRAIEPGTTEIVLEVARLSRWAYYHFDGRLRRRNWEKLHIASTRFNEPTLLRLLPQTQFVLSFHGEGSKRGRTIYVGGLYDEGRHALLESLNAGLADLGVRALDALASRHAEEIAGRSPDNITNCGRLGAGVQLEFSLGARLAFFESLTRAGRRQPRAALGVLARSIDRALGELTRRP